MEREKRGRAGEEKGGRGRAMEAPFIDRNEPLLSGAPRLRLAPLSLPAASPSPRNQSSSPRRLPPRSPSASPRCLLSHPPLPSLPASLARSASLPGSLSPPPPSLEWPTGADDRGVEHSD